MGKTNIEWCDFSINPIRARNVITGAVGHYCEKVSHGCTNCYASCLQRRFQMKGFPPHQKDKDIAEPNLKGTVDVAYGMEVFLDDRKLEEVLKRQKPTKYFWCDMTDMFGWWVHDSWLDSLFHVMIMSPQHTHMVLTKRPERMWNYLRNNKPYPHSNIWLGVSVEDQATANARILFLLQTSAAVRFLSVEPLLGEIEFATMPNVNGYGEGQRWYDPLKRSAWVADGSSYYDVCPCKEGIDWVIVGGESGPDARPMHPDWARSIRNQCQESGVPFFFKQWGEYQPVDQSTVKVPKGTKEYVFDDGTILLRVGKHAAGRLLDGKEWSQFPTPVLTRHP